MIKKVVGIALILVAFGLLAFIITSVGQLIPHIIGPIILTVLGVSLLIPKRKVDASTK